MKTVTFDETQWQLVPVEPTRGMTQAGIFASHSHGQGWGDVYRAMLSAAPQAPAINQQATSEDKKDAALKLARDALASLYQWAGMQVCCHDETHRDGAIWEVCDQCGAKWADDEGGKPEFKWPTAFSRAEAAITAIDAAMKGGE